MKTEIMNLQNDNQKTIIKKNDDIQKENFKRCFNRDELKSFTQRANYTQKMEKITDDKTDIFIDIEEHYKDEDEVKVGFIIDNKYELTELITKKSGEAAIYKCSVRGLSGTYVAKVYYPNIQPKEDIMEKLLNNLSSENVVRINMIGFILTNSGRRLYEIMPFYSKGNLEMRMPLCEAELVEKIIPSINEGLRAIHRLNIIHRDLKPNNLFITEEDGDSSKPQGFKLYDNERIVIGDFGISSQIKDGQTHRVTSANRTRGYGAPEMIRDNITTPKSDYFAFGITLLTLLVGEYPYHDEIEMILKIKEDVWDFPEGVSLRMQELIKGLMEYDRNKRFGYDDVKNWLMNKDVVKKTVKKRVLEDVSIRDPYEFKFKKYFRLVDLAEAMIQDWNFSLQHIENRFIDKYFRGVSKEFDEILTDMDRLRHIGVGNDKIFLTFIYSVLEYDGIIYQDLNFQNISDMSDYILSCKEIDKRIIKMINNKSLFFILSLVNKYSHHVGDMSKLKGIIDRIESLCKTNDKEAFYLLGFVLNNDKLNVDIAKKGIIKADYPITDINGVYRAFEEAVNQNEFSDRLMNNPCFLAWLKYKGYGKKQRAAYKAIID